MINLGKKTIGIDISDHAIQVVELAGEDGKINIKSFGRKNIVPGIVKNGRIKNYDKLEKALKEAFGDARLNSTTGREIYVSLPENQVYMHISEIGPKAEQPIKKMVEKNIANTFPININELLYTYKLSNSASGQSALLIVAVRRKTINEWEYFFKRLGIKITEFDFEALATFRGLFSARPDEPIGLLGIGASSTNFSIFNSAGIAYSYALPKAGNFFTRKIAEELKISEEEAEELKIKNGLSGDMPEAGAVLKGCLDDLFKEIEQNIAYFHKQHKETIKKLYIYGGSSKTRGLKEYLIEQNFIVELEVARPRLGSDNLSQEYIGAVGLALKGLEEQWANIDPCFLPSTVAGHKFNFIRNIFGARKNLKNINKIIVIIILLFSLYFAGLFFWLRENQSLEENNYLNKHPAASTTTPKKIPEKKQEIKPRIKIKNISSSLNVRSGPGTSYKIIGKASGDEIFTLVGEKDGWYQIVLKDNETGWIFSEFSEKLTP